MRILFLSLQALLILKLTTAYEPVQTTNPRLPVQRPETNQHVQSTDLLTTLKELHESLIKQIALLENMQRNSDMIHLVLHYTAQKNNVEREIELLKSIETSPMKDTSPRQIYKTVPTEERFFQNIFRNTKDPSSTQQANDIDKQSLFYPTYYDQDPQLLYSYQEPQRPVQPYPNDLITDTFPGYQPQSYHQQMITDHRHVYQESMSAVPPHPPAATLQAQIPPSRLMELTGKGPQRLPAVQRPAPQLTQSNKIESQPTTTIRPLENSTRPPPFGQKQGISIYYPDNIVIQDENQYHRPTIVDRFGQVLDRFGQVISNLSNRQPLRPLPENDANVSQKKESMSKRSRPRDRMSPAKDEMKIEAKNVASKRQKLRWVSV